MCLFGFQALWLSRQAMLLQIQNVSCLPSRPCRPSESWDAPSEGRALVIMLSAACSLLCKQNAPLLRLRL